MRSACRVCGIVNNLYTPTTCERCANKNAEYVRAYNARHKMQGLCVECWSKPEPGRVRCAKHLERVRVAKAKYLAKRARAQLCE